METSKVCSCGEKHTGHICLLRSDGKTEEIKHITDNPKVSCFTCGAEANSPDNVCSPVVIERVDY